MPGDGNPVWVNRMGHRINVERCGQKPVHREANILRPIRGRLGARCRFFDRLPRFRLRQAAPNLDVATGMLKMDS